MKLRAWLRIAAAAVWTLALLPLQVLALWMNRRGFFEFVPMLYHRGLARILGLRVRVVGKPCLAQPTLYVANHVSWIDIIVLDTILKASFVAKMDVAEWPIFGLLAKLQRTVFVERRAARTREHRDEMLARLEAGDRLILFAEGTSHDGLRVLPFKSAFFAVAERRYNETSLPVQPVSIAYTRLNNMPSGRRFAGLFAWIGDQELGPHIMQFLSVLSSQATVVFHPPLWIEEHGSRKELTQAAEAAVRQGLSRANAGCL